MARPVRVEYEGAVYHVTARGNERRRIFLSDNDRQLFLDTLQQMVERFGVMLHAYCLMPNHYHLVLETPQGNLTQSVGWLQTTYTIRYNRGRRRSGHLFQGRFKAHVVGADEYAQQLVQYVHLNPVRPRDKSQPIPAGRAQALEKYPWSSHRAYAGTASAPEWLTLEWLAYWGQSRRAAQDAYRRTMRALCGGAALTPWKNLRGGLVLGGEKLWKRVTRIVREKSGHEERAWRRREGRSARRTLLATLIAQEPNPKINIWTRVTLGGEKPAEVGRALGYRDGSGVLQVIKRLEHAALQDKTLAKKMDTLRTQVSSVES